jgi:hypothetical protein
MDDKEEDGAYLPSLEEIEDQCSIIRSAWSESKKKSRKVVHEGDLFVREISIKDICLE